MRVLTHKPPGHIDDFLAVNLILYKYDLPTDLVEFRSEVSEEELDDPSVFVIDVGGRYEPDLKNFDHHQDLEIPCAFMLVLKHEFPELYEELKDDEALKTLDFKDRFGPQKAGLPNHIYNSFVEKVLLHVPLSKEVGKAVYEYLKHLVDKRSELKKVKVYDSIAFRLAIYRGDNPSISDIFITFGATFAVIPDRRSEGRKTSVVRNSSISNVEQFDLTKIKIFGEPTFVHKGGFIAVFEKNLSEFKDEEILAHFEEVFTVDF